MEENIKELFNKGYKILKFQRDVDIVTGTEIGIIELKDLDGYRKVISMDDNKADEIEKVLYNYLNGTCN